MVNELNGREKEKNVPGAALTFSFFPYNFSKWILRAETPKANAMQLLRLIHLASTTLNFKCARRSPTQGTNIKSHGNASIHLKPTSQSIVIANEIVAHKRPTSRRTVAVKPNHHGPRARKKNLKKNWN